MNSRGSHRPDHRNHRQRNKTKGSGTGEGIHTGELVGNHDFDEIREQQCKMLRGRACEPCVCRQDEFETTRMVQNRGR